MLKDKYCSGYNITSFQIAATYIGTVVGAGFASGQEVLQFFGYYGLGGFAGLMLTTLIFMAYGYIILRLGMKYNASSFQQILKYAVGKWLGTGIDISITFFLFGALTAMIAGAGAVCHQQFGIPVLLGNIIMAVLAIFTTILGIRGVVRAISLLVPLLMVGLITVTVISFFSHLPLDLIKFQQSVPGNPAVPNWALSAVVYASYNLVVAVAVLAPLGAEVNDKEKIKKGSIFGSLGLGLGILALVFTLELNLPQAANYEIPMVYIAGNLHPWIKLIYGGIMLIEIYTTAVANLYGFTARFIDSGSSDLAYRTFIGLAGIAALIASRFGFSNLVHYLYPLAGYAGFLLIAGLTYGYFKQR